MDRSHTQSHTTRCSVVTLPLLPPLLGQTRQQVSLDPCGNSTMAPSEGDATSPLLGHMRPAASDCLGGWSLTAGVQDTFWEAKKSSPWPLCFLPRLISWASSKELLLQGRAKAHCTL